MTPSDDEFAATIRHLESEETRLLAALDEVRDAYTLAAVAMYEARTEARLAGTWTLADIAKLAWGDVPGLLRSPAYSRLVYRATTAELEKERPSLRAARAEGNDESPKPKRRRPGRGPGVTVSRAQELLAGLSLVPRDGKRVPVPGLPATAQTVRNWAARGVIPSYRPDGGPLRILLDEDLNWLDEDGNKTGRQGVTPPR